jgi:hypothetical protein
MQGDCCDNGGNLIVAAAIHPGVDFQTVSAGGICGITWDFDCDGVIKKSVQERVGCGSPPSCPVVYADFADSACGTIMEPGGCANEGGFCGLVAGGGVPSSLGCK